MPAPRNPWIARQTIISSIVVAKPHKKLAMVKPEAEIANSSRVPSTRDRKPDSGIAITSAIRYRVWTHDTSVELADKPAWMSVSEAETIWMSRIDMNIPNNIIRNATRRRGVMRSEAGGASIITGLAVVALAMVCSTRHAIRSQKTEQFGLSPSGRGDLDPRHYVAIRMSAAIIETQNMMASCFVTFGVHR